MSTRRRRRAADHEEEHANHERWLLTYADMITLLMVLFIVLFAISEVDNKKFDELHDGLSKSFGKARLLDGSTGVLQGSRVQAPAPDNGQEARIALEHQQEAVDQAKAAAQQMTVLESQIRSALTARGLAGSVQYDRQARGLVIDIVTDKVLFDLGSAELRPQGEQVLAAIAPALRGVGNDLSVEGHTDNVPISGGRYASNWELSAERATTVLRFLLSQRISADRVAAAGYADQRPLLPNNSPAHRARNRRVAIVVLAQSAAPLPAADLAPGPSVGAAPVQGG